MKRLLLALCLLHSSGGLLSAASGPSTPPPSTPWARTNVLLAQEWPTDAQVSLASTFAFPSAGYLFCCGDGWTTNGQFWMYQNHGDPDDPSTYVSIHTGTRMRFDGGIFGAPLGVDTNRWYYAGSVTNQGTNYTFRLYTTLADARARVNAMHPLQDTEFPMVAHVLPNANVEIVPSRTAPGTNTLAGWLDIVIDGTNYVIPYCRTNQ